MVPFMRGTYVYMKQIHRENRSEVTRGCGEEGDGELVFNGRRILMMQKLYDG